jgi:integrase
MARPWPKKSAWPYVAKSGRRSYVVGFYDHDKVERSRAFPLVRHARAWMDDYMTAERRGRESLRRFLLDLDAKEANAAEEARTIAEVLELYLAVDAHPRNEGGLAPSTYERYEWMIGRHLLGKPRRSARGGTRPPPIYALEVASVPAVRFNEPQAPRAWREDMLRAGVPKPTRDQAWSVLSAALGWAAGSQMVPEIQTNGCRLANEPRVNRRRSMRNGGTGYTPTGRRRGLGVASWALSPQAVEAIRAQMLLQVNGRGEILAHRDAMIVSLQYGLGARNQEVWGLRWTSLDGEFAWVLEVLSSGQLNEWGKTEHSTQRRTAMPSILREDLSEWRATLRRSGHPARDVDFIIPGDLASAPHGIRDPHTGACHLSSSQARSWGARFFTPAVKKAAQRPELTPILGATPYALRRGGISLRLRAEDPQTVASECGTSLRMLSDHYAFAIQDLRRFGPRPVDVEWRDARAAQTQHDLPQQPTPAARAPRRHRLFAWFTSDARRPGALAEAPRTPRLRATRLTVSPSRNGSAPQCAPASPR